MAQVALQLILMISMLSMPAGEQVKPVAIPLDASPKNVVLIGWDGVQREHLQQCLDRHELPNLQALGEAGSLVEIDVTETTDTKSGWAQILTGYKAEVTGVYSNANYRPIPQGYSLFERLEGHFGADQVITLAVISKDEHVGNNPPERIALDASGKLPLHGLEKGKSAKKAWRNKLRAGHVVDTGDGKFLEIPGKPYFITQNAMDLFENGLHQNDKVGTRALELLDKYKDQRLCMFIHFGDVDSNGHKYGENSAEYTAAMVSCDSWLGRIEAKLDALGLSDETLIYVTADHGFDEGLRSHKNAPYVFLATNDTSVRASGTRADITPTILHRLRLDIQDCQPALDGIPLN